MLQRVIAAMALSGLSFSLYAESIDVNLSNDSARFEYAAPFKGAEYDAGFLYNEDDDWVLHGGLLTHGLQETGASRIRASFGGRVFLASANDKEALALGLGGRASVFPSRMPVGIGAYFFYAPNVVTGLDAERFRDYGVRLEWEAMETTSVYLGYRRIRMRLKNGSEVDVDKGGHLGLIIRF